MQHQQSPPQQHQPSPPLQSGDDGLVRAMSTKYAAERASAKNTPATMRSADPTPRVGAFSPNAHTQATPSGRARQHNPYRSSDALRALPDEPSVAASAMLPSAAAAAPAGLRARRDPPPAAPPSTGSPFGSKGGYQAPKLGAATAVGAGAAAAISDSDDDADGPVQGTDSLTVGGARLSPGAVYNPDVANGAVRSNRSPYLGTAPSNLPSTVGHATVRRTPGARAAPDAAQHQHQKPGIATPSFSSSGAQSAAQLPPRYADPHKQPMQPQQQAQTEDQHGALRNSRETAGRASARPAGPSGSDAPAPFTARDMERILQSAIAAGNAAESSEAAPCADVGCPAGLSLTVYNGDISQHFSIPSEHVQITRGAIKYVDHHARYGAQTRFRFQLCHNFLLRKCPKLSECSYIHATQLPAPTQVHLNPFAPRRLAADRHGRSNEVPYAEVDDPAIANSYECLPEGSFVVVYPPDGAAAADSEPPMQVPSHMVIKTAGASRVWTAMQRNAPLNVRHCESYQLKRVCNLGVTCHGIHSKVPYLGADSNVPPGASIIPQVGTVVVDPGRKPVPLEFEAESNGHVRAKARPGAKPRAPPQQQGAPPPRYPGAQQPPPGALRPAMGMPTGQHQQHIPVAAAYAQPGSSPVQFQPTMQLPHNQYHTVQAHQQQHTTQQQYAPHHQLQHQQHQQQYPNSHQQAMTTPPQYATPQMVSAPQFMQQHQQPAMGYQQNQHQHQHQHQHQYMPQLSQAHQPHHNPHHLQQQHSSGRQAYAMPIPQQHQQQHQQRQQQQQHQQQQHQQHQQAYGNGGYAPMYGGAAGPPQS